MSGKRSSGKFLYDSRRGSRRKKKKRGLLLQVLLLLLFGAALIYGAFIFFGDRYNGDTDALPVTSEETSAENLEQDQKATIDETEDLLPVPEEAEDSAESSVLPEPAISGLQVISDGNCLLALVTKETTLKRSYSPTDLKRIPDYMYPARVLWLREEALGQLEKLWQAATDDGVTLTIISAYRSYDYQQTLFQSYATSHGGEEAANRFSARAGQSEHQLGTTVDFGGTAFDLKAAYADTDQGNWLANNAYRFGFVMSYPEGKEEITGYIFEPWHYRYIGLEAAQEWYASGLSLKEFLQQKPQCCE